MGSIILAAVPASGLLDPQAVISGAGVWGLAVVCAIVFAETGLLVGFFLPGDTLLFFTGVLALSGVISQPLWIVVPAIALSAALGDQLGYVIGRRSGPRIFDRRESGLFSRKSVKRTQGFFDRFGPAAVTVARFVPVVRTFAPVAAGVGTMPRRLFTMFNLVGAAVWSSAVVLLGFGLAHIPGVADFAARYIDLILIGIVVASVLPLLVKAVIGRQRPA
ncbi:DedA family protein [Cryobacterium sp. TMT1-21]|uniref:DedA family protein n=1 Tax=Cryobacterium shii TaxID=1259235 RepID=A0AAQ2C666_9MICO|nr:MULTISPECIES: VTT domain-containing protein [Cryobacterium]TFC47371.1 DedA family protein [Cryobacterium shii]TFC89321.1 DedA family protein [Cryobacterium sp. TmT2-59]TFD07388.1 DedA family protein [Cryobacterium sp. TMT1-21]TFD17444.1 DedA family protein [Cryobacterium sp. TMT2-23]TFD36157.1 DedA family protein [Cryobacterium sp. TMT2-10]